MDIFLILLYLLPIYFSNAIPVVLGGVWEIDRGILLPDGRRLFGKNKTIVGFVSGFSSGVIVAFFLKNWFFLPLSYLRIEIAMCFFAMVGDLIGSFIKRRLGIEEGGYFFPDTFLFLLFSFLFSYLLFPNYFPVVLLDLRALIFAFLLTIFLHIVMNRVANLLGLKRVAW